MTHLIVSALIERLSECDPEAEVLIASQPSWPMQHRLMGVATGADIAGDTACEQHDSYSCDECEVSSVVYLVEGDQPSEPYAPHAAWEVAR